MHHTNQFLPTIPRCLDQKHKCKQTDHEKEHVETRRQMPDGKEETLLFGDLEIQEIRILGSYVGRAKNLEKRKERGNKTLWTLKRRLKGSTQPKRLQARAVEACVESTIIFETQARPWRE